METDAQPERAFPEIPWFYDAWKLVEPDLEDPAGATAS